jgi:hypothetical protein
MLKYLEKKQKDSILPSAKGLPAFLLCQSQKAVRTEKHSKTLASHQLVCNPTTQRTFKGEVLTQQVWIKSEFLYFR